MLEHIQQTPFVVGAYASMPADQEGQAQYYQLLGAQTWIAGTELPYPGNLAEQQSLQWLAEVLPGHWHTNTLTAIPGTMQHVWKDGSFGLASPDEQGRAQAIAWVREIRDAVAEFARLRGSQDIAAVELHSAPTRYADASAFRQSLKEINSWDWSGAKIVIEHCDRYIDGQKPEKGFLSIEQEIEIAQALGIGITINWGRSSVEGRDVQTPLRHIQQASEAGVLRGLMFSGAGPEATQYGYEWIDGHLPMQVDEPTSLMDAAHIVACVQAVFAHAEFGHTDAEHAELGNVGILQYLGAKNCVPKDADLPTRLSYLAHIHDAVLADSNV